MPPLTEPPFADPVSRRRFLELMGASIAMAAMAGCSRAPLEKIVPYVRQPEDFVPGNPLWFATSFPMAGYAEGVLAESHLGRPTKLEGNPDHPASLGASDVWLQGSVLDLYDPDRSQAVVHQGNISTWDAFVADAVSGLAGLRTRPGAAFRILTPTVTSPSLAAGIRHLLAGLPNARWHVWDAVPLRRGPREGARLAFGRALEPVFHPDRAAVVASFDCDFLLVTPGHLSYARAFMAARNPAAGNRPAMNRLYSLESTPALTGAVADHRLPVRPSDVPALLLGLAHGLGMATAAPSALSAAAQAFLAALAADLLGHRGASLVLVDDLQPPEIHALAHAINAHLGNLGHTVEFIPPVDVQPVDPVHSLSTLVREMAAGNVDALVMLGGNPVYDSPADLAFSRALTRVPWTVHLASHEDETSQFVTWHLPEAHYLETWGDASAFDGTVGLQQPLIAPLYEGRSALEVVGMMTHLAYRPGHDLLRAYWRPRLPGANFELAWEQALNAGVVPGTRASAVPVAVRAGYVPPAVAAPGPESTLEIIFRPDPSVWDGRFANNGWLQELPRPITKLTWGNAALISPATARRFGVDREQVIALTYRGRTVNAPVFVVEGHPDDAVTLHLGYGRSRAGKVGDGVGSDAFAIRTSDALLGGPGATLAVTSERIPLASTQNHHRMEGRHPARSGTFAEYLADPGFDHAVEEIRPPYASLYPGFAYPDHAWAMAIDLNACIGCNACTIACQAENNIPVVGKDEVLMHREMHWIRVDADETNDAAHPDPANPARVFQPIPCMQCENAPCEVVCPVEATVHDAEGLNEMIYNRCVGTRYCSNNCPYKVRRFNFYQYVPDTPSLKLQRNPDVTVRTRGVMEKCTYCIQRIKAVKIDAEVEGRPIRDGEIKTACQQACPSNAIVFGDRNDSGSKVARLQADPRNYALLGHLDTRPRTTYLAKLANPNPALELAGWLPPVLPPGTGS